jgi:dienelactone hydrolase
MARRTRRCSSLQSKRLVRSLVVGLVVLVAAASCSGEGSGPRAVPPIRTTVPPSTVPPATPPVTTVPDIGEVPRPANVADTAFQWYVHPADNAVHVLVGVRRQAGPGPHPGILLVPASGGLNADYVAFADKLAARGFDVAVGCWFASVDVSDPLSIVIPCTDAPAFKGVVDAAVPDLDSLVEATHHALGASTPLALVGFSRGGGIIALRASEGQPELVVLVSGLFEGWNGIGSHVPGGEVNVVERVDGWRAPTLLLHGTNDAAVPVVQPQHLEAALRLRGVDVAAHYYEGAGHNLDGDPAVGTDLVDQITQFVCARMACAA